VYAISVAEAAARPPEHAASAAALPLGERTSLARYVQVPDDLPDDDQGMLTGWSLVVLLCGARPSVTVSHAALAGYAGVGRDTVLAWLARAQARGWLAVRRGRHMSTYRPLRRPQRGDGRRYVEVPAAAFAALDAGTIRVADLRTLVRELRADRSPGHTGRPLVELAKLWGVRRDDLSASRRRLATAGLPPTQDTPPSRTLATLPDPLPAAPAVTPEPDSDCPPNPTVGLTKPQVRTKFRRPVP